MNTGEDLVLDIEGMTCASCVTKVERALGGVEGVDAVTVNLASRTAHVRAPKVRQDRLIEAVRRTGYGATQHSADGRPVEEVAAHRRRLVAAVLCTLPVLWLSFLAPDLRWSEELAWALTTPVVLYAGWPFHRSALRAARHGATTMDTLISIGSLAAYGASVWAVVTGDDHHYFDTAAVIVTLILVGKMLEARARLRAGDAARTLLERGAEEATLLEPDGERRVAIEELRPGQTVVVRAGEKIPADGVVTEGNSWVDLSLLTGESVPVDVGPGDEVVGASINGHGRLVVFVSTVGSATKLAQIVRLLEAAQGSRAPVQRLADRISAVFVPAVIGLAIVTAVGWTLTGSSPSTAILHAVAVVLIACPCALGLATPAAIMAGTGRAAELGILFKGGEAIEAGRSVDLVLLDKTGTVTEGAMSLTDVVTAGDESSEALLALAAAAEGASDHPIARAVVEGAVARGIGVPDATDHEVRPGAGVRACVEGAEIVVGRPVGLPATMRAEVDRLAGGGRTPFAVWREGVPMGLIAVSDRVKPEAAEAVARLLAMGLEVRLLTGDHERTSWAVASSVGIPTMLAEVLPDGKVAEVRRLQAAGRHVALAGDGINDAPALVAADLGIAMGTGTDVAWEAADVSLLGGSLTSVPDALAIARRTYRLITQNLFLAFAYNVVMIPLAVAGLLTPAWAAGAMAASSVSVVANALRLRSFGRGTSAAAVV